MQRREASEVQKGAEEASISSIHALQMEGVTDKDYETQTLSGVVCTLWEARPFSRKGPSLRQGFLDPQSCNNLLHAACKVVQG